jgi:hypothetical protein
MARDAVVITNLTLNTGTDTVAGTTLDAANDLIIAAAGNTERLLVEITNTDEAAKTVTVVAGVNPPAFRAGLGDATYEIGASETALFVLESARFAQSDGAIHIDLETDHTGVAKAYRLPY